MKKGLEIIHEVRIRRPDYFHVLVRLTPTDTASRDVLSILPLTVGEELVADDKTGVVNAEEELIGETLDNINGLRWEDQIEYFCSKQLGSNEDKLLTKYFVMHVIQKGLSDNLNMERFRIVPYGSSISGFSNKYSDLDMCLIDRKAAEYENINTWRNDATEIMSQMFQALNPRKEVNRQAKVQHCRSIIQGIEKHTLIKARHPIIASVYNYMDMEFDLGYNDPSVVEMSRLHNLYSSQNVTYRQMISLLRIWGKLNGLTEHGLTQKLTPYILTQLACNFLQNDGLVPMLRQMSNKSSDGFKFCDFKLGFKADLEFKVSSGKSLLYTEAMEKYPDGNFGHIKDPTHILALFYGFFDYVDQFFFLDCYSDSNTGVILRKTRDHSSDKVIITHPFNPKVNVADGIGPQFFTIFQDLCKEAKYQVLYILNESATFPSNPIGLQKYFF